MTDEYLDDASFDNMLAEPLRLYEHALSIWNHAGLNYQALSVEAKDISTSILQRSIGLLESIKGNRLSSVQEVFVGAYVHLANSQILFILSSCENMETLESLQERHHLLAESIDLRDQAYASFIDTVADSGKSFLSGLKLSILSDRAMIFSIKARICSRQHKLEEARDAYNKSEGLYLSLLKLYEEDTPELIEVSKKIHSRIENNNAHDDSKDIEGIELGGYSIVFDDDFREVPDLDMYQRIWANYYSVRASHYLTDAYILISQHEDPRVIVENIDSAISCVYSAMEFFPNQLNFHQDLFNAYHIKGVLFGCPVLRRANFYYTICPLAIMRYIGHWYLSAGIRYKSLVCNVCGKDAIECQHSPGQVVNGVTVEYSREGMYLEEISTVDVPRDPRCRIKELKIPITFFDKLIPKGKSQLEKGELFCHLCNVEPSDLEKFPLLIDLNPESADKVRKRYMAILDLDAPKE